MAVRSLLTLICLAALLAPSATFAQTPHKKKQASHSKKKHVMTAKERARLRHMKRAFVASADLKPMAQQLLENRSPQAYAGVEEYAHRHRKDDAAPLAWLVLGYAHYLDKDYIKARDSWKTAQPLEPVLGDYLEWLKASAWQGENLPFCCRS